MGQDNNPSVTKDQVINYLRNQIKKQGIFPAGHYYSPIPSEEEVLEQIKSIKPPGNELPGINLNTQHQFEVLNKYIQFYKDLPFTEKQTTGLRYYYDNNWFSYADAIFLYSFLRLNKPRRIIEVGSGFSSAVILDTVDGFFSQQPEITFIEPNPDRLNSILKSSDKKQVRVLENRIQDVPVEVLLSLEAGDFLFIDSSHVLKCGSDLQLLMFEILPVLQAGVFVHFHDIFYPFEYPEKWLKEGRYWNENYFLRAFLSYNSEWNIYFFNSFVKLQFDEFIEKNLPLSNRKKGGSIYIQRKQIE